VKPKLLLVILLGLGAACQGDKPHKITDLETGNVYYTTHWRRGLTSGNIYLRDGKTGEKVTVQSSQIEKMTEEDYRRAIDAK
jgi:hypothetical protein